MESFTANEAKVRFGEFIDHVQRGPVRVTRRGRVVARVVTRRPSRGPWLPDGGGRGTDARAVTRA